MLVHDLALGETRTEVTCLRRTERRESVQQHLAYRTAHLAWRRHHPHGIEPSPLRQRRAGKTLRTAGRHGSIVPRNRWLQIPQIMKVSTLCAA